MLEKLNAAYSDRNRLAIAFAKAAAQLPGFKAGYSLDESNDEGWQTVVRVIMPNGDQVAWHMAPAEETLARAELQYMDGVLWDGTFLGREAEWPKRF